MAAYTRVKPLEWGLGLDDERFDNEGRVIWLKFEDFRLFNIYFPNGQRGKERVDYKLDFYSRLLDICDKLHADGEKIVITGDFNTSHREIDLANRGRTALFLVSCLKSEYGLISILSTVSRMFTVICILIRCNILVDLSFRRSFSQYWLAVRLLPCVRQLRQPRQRCSSLGSGGRF